MDDLLRAARSVVSSHLGVKKGETTLVIVDEKRRSIGLKLFQAAVEVGSEAVLMEMIERADHGNEPPDAVAKAMLTADVIIAPTTMSLSHTAAREAATASGSRIATMPMVTEEMMSRALGADPDELRRLGRQYSDELTKAKTARVTAPGGTDCTFDLSGREGIPDDGILIEKGAFGNLPAGEAFIAPVEGKTQGIIVFDGSISPDGLTETPVAVTVKDGRVTKVTGGPAPKFEALAQTWGPLAWEVAELGIGTNDKAIITGIILEDEKVASTIHVAFGNNATIGGVTEVPSHHDGVIRDASIEFDFGEMGRLNRPESPKS